MENIINSGCQTQDELTAEEIGAAKVHQESGCFNPVLGVQTQYGFVGLIQIPCDEFLWQKIQQSAKFYCEKWYATTANPYHGERANDLLWPVWEQMRQLMENAPKTEEQP